MGGGVGRGSLPADSLLKSQQPAGLKPELRTEPRSPMWESEIQSLECHHCLPEAVLARSWSQEPEPGAEPRCSKMERGHLHPNACPHILASHKILQEEESWFLGETANPWTRAGNTKVTQEASAVPESERQYPQ